MSKRIISAILGIVFLTITVLPCLSGCSAVEDETHYTVMQWLDQVEEKFNLLYYSEQEPLIKTVNTSDSGFETVQIAAEWGIIEPDDEIKFNDKLTKELAADTLVRAMNCVSLSTADFSDSGDVNPIYLDRVMSSVNEGIFDLESGKFLPKKQITKDEADAAMAIAYDKWVNFSYGGVSYDRSTVKENVINLGGVISENCDVVPALYTVEYTGIRSFFDDNGGYTDNTNKTITFSAGQAPTGLAVEKVLAMPADDVIPMDYAVVVTGIAENSDGSVTVTTRNAELQDVYDEIDVQQSGALDFSKAIFYGPDGQRLNIGYDNDAGVEAVGLMSVLVEPEKDISPRTYRDTNVSATMMVNTFDEHDSDNYVKKLDSHKGSAKIKLIDTDDSKLYLTVSASLGSGEGGLGLKIEGEIKDGDEKLAAEIGFDKTVKVENRVKTHWDWFKLKVDELKLSVTDETTETFGYTCSAAKTFGSIINKYHDKKDSKKGFDIGDWSDEGHKLRDLYQYTKTVGESFTALSKKAKEASNKKLVDVIFPGTHLHFVIRAEFTVEGSVKLTLTQSNTIGAELVNGKLRAIKESSNSRKLDFSAKAELTARIGIEFQLIGIDIADIGVKAGLGAKVSSIMYSYDKSSDTLLEVCGIEGAFIQVGGDINAGEGVDIAETGLPVPDYETRRNLICNELKIYPIVSGYLCSSLSIVGKLFGSIEFEFLGENTPLLLVHADDGKIVSECSISANDSYGVVTGNKLTLNSDSYAIPVSDDADLGLAVATLPVNVTINDVTIESDNTEVLEVENLMHKVSGFDASSIKPKIVIKAGIGNIIKAANNALDGGANASKNSLTYSYTFGSWFYDELSGSSKPQFALTGKKNGTANVTITAGGESVTIPVQVGTGEEPVVSTGSLISTKGTFTLAPGETAQTAFDFIPEGKAIGDITFTSENSSVASVSGSGLITAVGEGDVNIKAVLKGEDEEYSTTFVVHVIEPQAVTYTNVIVYDKKADADRFEWAVAI